MTEALARTSFRGRVSTAPQDDVVGPITPAANGKAHPRAEQLALF
jgi:hypothetical protein